MKIFISKSLQDRLKLTNTKDYTLTNELETDVTVFIGFEATAQKLMKSLPNLKYILLTTAGYNEVDLSYVKAQKITLTNATGVFSIPIAESIVSNILAFNRKHSTYFNQQQKGQWIRHEDLIELTGAHVGFLGGGSIAEATLTALKGFNITSSVYRKTANKGPFDKVYTTKAGLKTLFKESDYIINTLPFNKDTEDLVDETLLSLAKPNLFYVNVGRGQTNDEKAILMALRNKTIRGAYLDVFKVEPLIDNYYLEPNLIITPHNSQSSTKNNQRLHDLMIKNLENIVHHRALINKVDID